MAVLASLLFCGTLAQTHPFSEAKAPAPVRSTPPALQRHADRDDEVSPLFLALLGLAALALSQTRPSDKPTSWKDDSCTGKNVARGQKLPEVRPPQPPLATDSGVIAGKHHHDIVGLETIGVVGMLHQ